MHLLQVVVSQVKVVIGITMTCEESFVARGRHAQSITELVSHLLLVLATDEDNCVVVKTFGKISFFVVAN